MLGVHTGKNFEDDFVRFQVQMQSLRWDAGPGKEEGMAGNGLTQNHDRCKV